MSATYRNSMVALGPIEGGYCPGGMACGSRNSGETYRGIDRKFHPELAGWAIIDEIKRRQGSIRNQSFISDPRLDAAVANFYTTFWNRKGMGNFKNQTLAALVWALVVHRENAGIRRINAFAKRLGAKTFASTSITPSVAQTIESNLVRNYELLHADIRQYYRQFKDGATFIRNRVDVFPASLAPRSQQQQGGNTASGLEAAGLIFSVIKMFF